MFRIALAALLLGSIAINAPAVAPPVRQPVQTFRNPAAAPARPRGKVYTGASRAFSGAWVP